MISPEQIGGLRDEYKPHVEKCAQAWREGKKYFKLTFTDANTEEMPQPSERS
jgi:hypothetical protein